MTVIGRGRLPYPNGGEPLREAADSRLFLRVAYAWKAQGWSDFFGWIASGPARWRLGMQTALDDPRPRTRRRAAVLYLGVVEELTRTGADVPEDVASELRAFDKHLRSLPQGAQRAALWRESGSPRPRRKRRR